MPNRHPVRWVLSAVVIVVIAFAAYAGWLLWDTSRQLTAASDAATTAKSELLAGDGASAQTALDSFAHHASIAADRTDSPVWSLMTHVPKFGDDAHGVRTVSQVADDLGNTGLKELASTVDDIDAVLPKNGGIDLATVSSLQQPVDRGHAALVRARNELATEDPSTYVESLKLRYRDLQATIDDAADAMGVADRALKVLPDMLGADGPRKYLLVFQNNAEIRATGGLPGSVSLLDVDDGHITLAKQRSGASFGEAPAPVLPLTDAEKKLYGRNLGTYFLDANATPDFPRSSALWAARWKQVEGDDVDGIISMDTVSLSYLLRALGPVDVDGVTLTPDNVVAELLSNVYARLPNPDDQDAFFRDVAATIFTKVTSYTGSTQQLLSALREGANEHRLLIHDFHDDVQSQLTGTAIAGEVTSADSKSSQIGVYFSDATLSKMSYYLRYDTQVTATSCVDGVQAYSGKLTLRSVAPKDAKTTLPAYVTGSGLPKNSAGDQLVAVEFYGPAGGTVEKLNDNQLSFDQVEVDDGTRQVRATSVLLRPGEVKDIAWSMQSAAGQTDGAQLTVTPPITGGTESTRVTSSCD